MRSNENAHWVTETSAPLLAVIYFSFMAQALITLAACASNIGKGCSVSRRIGLRSYLMSLSVTRSNDEQNRRAGEIELKILEQ